jgi:hypothetical protein
MINILLHIAVIDLMYCLVRGSTSEVTFYMSLIFLSSYIFLSVFELYLYRTGQIQFCKDTKEWKINGKKYFPMTSILTM